MAPNSYHHHGGGGLGHGGYGGAHGHSSFRIPPSDDDLSKSSTVLRAELTRLRESTAAALREAWDEVENANRSCAEKDECLVAAREELRVSRTREEQWKAKYEDMKQRYLTCTRRQSSSFHSVEELEEERDVDEQQLLEEQQNEEHQEEEVPEAQRSNSVSFSTTTSTKPPSSSGRRGSLMSLRTLGRRFSSGSDEPCTAEPSSSSSSPSHVQSLAHEDTNASMRRRQARQQQSHRQHRRGSSWFQREIPSQGGAAEGDRSAFVLEDFPGAALPPSSSPSSSRRQNLFSNLAHGSMSLAGNISFSMGLEAEQVTGVNKMVGGLHRNEQVLVGEGDDKENSISNIVSELQQDNEKKEKKEEDSIAELQAMVSGRDLAISALENSAELQSHALETLRDELARIKADEVWREKEMTELKAKLEARKKFIVHQRRKEKECQEYIGSLAQELERCYQQQSWSRGSRARATSKSGEENEEKTDARWDVDDSKKQSRTAKGA